MRIATAWQRHLRALSRSLLSLVVVGRTRPGESQPWGLDPAHRAHAAHSATAYRGDGRGRVRVYDSVPRRVRSTSVLAYSIPAKRARDRELRYYSERARSGPTLPCVYHGAPLARRCRLLAWRLTIAGGARGVDSSVPLADNSSRIRRDRNVAEKSPAVVNDRGFAIPRAGASTSSREATLRRSLAEVMKVRTASTA